MQTLSSASRTCMASASAVECTTTVSMPSSLQARSTRRAISPRLAIRIFWNIARSLPAYSMTTSGMPYSTGCASSTRIAVTVPARGDGIWFIVFMASMMSSVWPSLTVCADLDERLGVGRRREIGGADHRRGHGVLRNVGRRGHCSSCRRRVDGDGRSDLHRGGGRNRMDRLRLTRHAHLEIAELDFDLGQVGVVQDPCEIADRAAGQNRRSSSSPCSSLFLFPVRAGRPAPEAPACIRAARSRRSCPRPPAPPWICGGRPRGRGCWKGALPRPATARRREWRRAMAIEVWV